jgi:hypothetical protein
MTSKTDGDLALEEEERKLAEAEIDDHEEDI